MKKRYLVVLILAALFVYSLTWTKTSHGRMDYLAAVSLKLLTFKAPVPLNNEEKIELPINLIFTMGRLAGVEDMASIENVQIPVGDTSILGRIYRPLRDSTSLPVIVYYHGGGFVLGDVDIFDQLTRALAKKTNAVVVSIDYRLAPKYPFPVPVNDAYAAFEWVANHNEIVKGNIQRIFVGGDSAGGTLAAVVAQRTLAEQGPLLSGQVLFYPGADLSDQNNWPSASLFNNGFGLDQGAMDAFRAAYLPAGIDRTNPYVSPIFAENFDGLAPAILLTAGFDPLRDSGIGYAKKMTDNGVDVDAVHFPETIHGFMSVAIFGEFNEALDRVAKFVASH
jgi:acetyl esterase